MIFPSLSTTPQQLLDAAIIRLKSIVYTEFNGLIETHNDWIRIVFDNFPYTASEIVSALNVTFDAAPLFIHTTNLRSLILSVAATQNFPVSSFQVTLLYPPSAFHIEDNNTVTLIPSAYSGQ